MGYSYSKSSLDKLKGVHPDLVRVMMRAIKITPTDFRITCGVRTLAEQKKLVAGGFSKTLNSRHLKASNGFSHAVDIVPLIGGKIRWDWPAFYPVAAAIKQAAKEEKVPIEWGGDWKKFKDGPHFQLPFASYPK